MIQSLAARDVIMKLTQALQAIRMSSKMNLQGLLAVLEDGEADLFARREAQFAPVPLTRVHFEVGQCINF